MHDLICPISSESLDKPSARVGATLTALLLVIYAATGAWPILVVVVLDYVIRVMTTRPAPISALARAITQAAMVPPKPMNKGPKIFAWRVGFVLAVASLALLAVSPTASVVVAVVLAGFNVLDGVFDLCVGCVVYTYLVLPRFGPPEARPH